MSVTNITTVATLLKTLGINQKELADAVGLKQSTISQYATGGGAAVAILRIVTWAGKYIPRLYFKIVKFHISGYSI